VHPVDIDPPLRTLLVEYQRLREHNLKVEDAAPIRAFALAEGALALMLLERFLRILLGPDASDRDTLGPLFQKATSRGIDLIDPPILFPYLPDERGATPARTLEKCRQFSTELILPIRNALVHGNYEQAARAHQVSVEAYFAQGYYRSDLDQIWEFIGAIWLQYDGAGERIQPSEQTRIREEDRQAAERRSARTKDAR
jgi:hypothetical protein